MSTEATEPEHTEPARRGRGAHPAEPAEQAEEPKPSEAPAEPESPPSPPSAASAARAQRAERAASAPQQPPVPEVTGVTGDARYDQERKVCNCGCGYFVGLNVGEVHVTQSFPFLMLLPPVEAQNTQVDVLRLPGYECVQCGSRYDRLWREVS
jgi:hypothetical protein